MVCLEQGAWVEPGDHPHYSTDWGWQRRTNWSSDVNKRHHPDDYPVETNSSQVLMWNGVGGSTNVYTAHLAALPPVRLPQGRRARPAAELANHLRGSRALLRRADRLIGVSGLAGDPAMPPRAAARRTAADHRAARRLAEASTRSAGTGGPMPAVISEDYDGRPPATAVASASGCPRGSMSKMSLSLWPKALARRRATADHTPACCAIERGRDGRATGASISSTATPAARVPTGASSSSSPANGVGTPRLLLATTTSPTLPIRSAATFSITHWTASEFWVDRSRSTATWAMTPPCLAANSPRPTFEPRLRQRFPLQLPDGQSAAGDVAAGWVPNAKAPWGRDHHEWFERHFGHGIGVFAIGDDLPIPNNRVTIDPRVRDADGVPVRGLIYEPGENDRRMMTLHARPDGRHRQGGRRV